MSAALAHAEDMRKRTEPQRGGHKEKAAQPHTTRHPVRGTHAVPFFAGQKGLHCRTATRTDEQQQLHHHPMQSTLADGHDITGVRDFTYSHNAFILLREAFANNDLLGLCVGPRSSLCQAPPLSRCLCRASALSMSGPGALSRALCVRPRCSLCRSLAVCVGPSALCVGPRRSLRRGPPPIRSALIPVSPILHGVGPRLWDS